MLNHYYCQHQRYGPNATLGHSYFKLLTLERRWVQRMLRAQELTSHIM